MTDKDALTTMFTRQGIVFEERPSALRALAGSNCTCVELMTPDDHRAAYPAVSLTGLGSGYTTFTFGPDGMLLTVDVTGW